MGVTLQSSSAAWFHGQQQIQDDENFKSTDSISPILPNNDFPQQIDTTSVVIIIKGAFGTYAYYFTHDRIFNFTRRQNWSIDYFLRLHIFSQAKANYFY